VELIQLTPQLHFIQFPVGHAYLWHDPDGPTLIDTGLPGSAPHIAAAIHQVGYQAADLRRLVLTHFHPDHIGAAAEIAGSRPTYSGGRGTRHLHVRSGRLRQVHRRPAV
jgi:glyoxylase-like metal-dependent hydrolase (beta-lactamase superfamily II)